MENQTQEPNQDLSSVIRRAFIAIIFFILIFGIASSMLSLIGTNTTLTTFSNHPSFIGWLADTFGSLSTELAGAGVTYLIFDRIINRREQLERDKQQALKEAQEREEREREREEQERKRREQELQQQKEKESKLIRNLKDRNSNSLPIGAAVGLRDENLHVTDILVGINLQRGRLEDVVLPNANFEEAIFRGASMEKINLINANLVNTDLSYANLAGAELQGANLQGAILDNANLKGAKLDRTDLSYASLRNVDLRDVDLTNAILDDAIMPQSDILGSWTYEDGMPIIPDSNPNNPFN